ncbi:hypothetical protein lerEdw1_008968 [Lerista edwardsae]|nr:hypothetical protein lerEdw1_008968 [Lerista edwardsae]
MAPMGIRLSPLGMAVFCLLGLGVLYHLYSGFLAGRFAFFMLGAPAAEAPAGSVDLRELLAAAVRAAVEGGEEVRRVREDNVLNEKAKGKTREGADELMTTGDFLSNRKMYYLLKTAFPGVQINTEEHVDEDDPEAISWDRTIPEDMRVIEPKFVQADSVTVWIDPLDATQEYTGYKVLSLLDVSEKNQEKADVYIHVTYIKKWDICAGNAVLKTLGGQMTTLTGEEISYTGSDGNEDGLIASINMNHRALIEKLPSLDKISKN